MSSRSELAHAVRMLAVDAVQAAKSGHPGMPMGMADMAEVLWNDFLVHNPSDPTWINRDRFVLSNGHGSMLLYALLHLSGYDLSMNELRNFRQLHSKTPGHPEYGMTPGVEVTTGPLGQGIAAAVGMAVAEKNLAAHFNQPGHEVIDHHTYVFLGDGCLMEGVSHEACSLAGTLGLGKLIALWDDNGISIDGEVNGWFGEDVAARYEAYGWQVIRDIDGHDAEAVHAAIAQAKAETARPSLLCCRTTIGFGSPKLAGTEKCHGAPLGDEEIAAVRAALDWSHAPFEIPAHVRAGWDAKERGRAAQQAWEQTFADYVAAHPELAAELMRRTQGEFPAGWELAWQELLGAWQQEGKTVATRKASQQCLEALGPLFPELLGGSADLSGSNLTQWSQSKPLNAADFAGNYLHYGVREFAMMAMMNGMALHGGVIPYGGTFLTFIDYGKNALRLAALMKQRVIAVLTHDSIGLGEDGPTHQPLEHAANLRAMPGVDVWRPCDAVETAVAWQQALLRQDGPSCLLLTRQGVPAQQRDANQLSCVAQGAYILQDSGEHELQAIILATGSEVALAMEAARSLQADGVGVRVVSVPCMERFAQQPEAYQVQVLPADCQCRVAVEAGVAQGWHAHVGSHGRVVSLEQYGESAPAAEVYKAMGLTTEAIVAAVKEQLT